MFFVNIFCKFHKTGPFNINYFNNYNDIYQNNILSSAQHVTFNTYNQTGYDNSNHNSKHRYDNNDLIENNSNKNYNNNNINNNTNYRFEHEQKMPLIQSLNNKIINNELDIINNNITNDETINVSNYIKNNFINSVSITNQKTIKYLPDKLKIKKITDHFDTPKDISHKRIKVRWYYIQFTKQKFWCRRDILSNNQMKKIEQYEQKLPNNKKYINIPQKFRIK